MEQEKPAAGGHGADPKEIAVGSQVSRAEIEQYRHECECRHQLDFTGGNPVLVGELIERITRKRGKAAADRLVDGMRAEFMARKKRARRERGDI